LAGRISDLSSNKLDTSAFSDVSGTFLTAHQDLSDYQTTADMTAYATVESLTAKQDAGDYLSATDSANFLLTSDSANFYTTANESGFITGVDLTPYQLTADMTAYQPTGDYLTTGDSANFYTTANESGFITGVPDTYLQNTDLTISDGKVTEISGVPLSAGDELPETVSAATDYVIANSATINGTVETVSSNSGVWGGEALPLSSRDGIDLEISGDMLYIGASALTASIDEKLDATVYATDSGSFLTAHQSLDGYLQNTDLEISDNKITGISGVPLAAGGGGDVPEGVMAESGLEYNAVDEISGYNGSAIAQYGAEKQWLVHDDTLVHASNSAQYALGVNVSAVQTLMGLDETVLFSGSESVSSCTLSEPWTAFDRLRLYVQNHAADGGVDVVELRPTSNGMYNYCGNWSWSDSDMLWVTVHGSATDTTLTNTKSWGFKNNFTSTSPTVRNNNNNDMQSILKVVGVGKKEIA
jgi:hypothetical protein